MRSRSIHHWKDKRGYLQPPTPATLPSLITSLPKLRGELVPQDPNDEARGGGNWEPNPARLPPPEECRSELRLYLLENPRNRRGEIYWHEEVVEKVYHWNPDAKAYDDKGGGVRIYGERIDLSELGTPEELANRVERFRVNADRELAAIAGR